ncbi:hypothetical protein N7G274_009682 [Stereocaulon virgatum]|uniref:PH domain-containing protein n=1 Tax=Stereocaulon virgatum TaxID=373712 RepID=A0ABR3ZWM4_9LECA
MSSRASTEPELTPAHIAEPGSYTAVRLQHASVEHVHITTRRCFIGPIPEGWLKSHRKSWYSQYLSLSDYSSRAATFSAKPGISHQRQITGLDGPSASAAFSQSFPQPEDADEEPQESDDDAGDSGEEQGHGHNGSELNEIEAQAPIEETNEGKRATGHVEEEPPYPKPKRRATFKDRLNPKKSDQKPRSSTYVTAPTKQHEPFRSRLSNVSSEQSKPAQTFVTAEENIAPRKNTKDVINESADEPADEEGHTLQQLPSEREDIPTSPSSAEQPRSSNGETTNRIYGDSTAALIPQGTAGRSASVSPYIGAKDSLQAQGGEGRQVPDSTAHGIVKFNVADKINRSSARTATTLSQAGRRRIWKRSRQGSSHPGEIVKMEKMLVRVDSTPQDLPLDYNENDSLKTSARTVEKWREFVVVCRESVTEDADFTIQMYKTRVIPSMEDAHVSKRSTHEIPLDRKTTHVNLYSSLDKTLVIWVPWKQGTAIHILRTHSAASAVEWYTFIRQSLGWQRYATLQVNVPDLSISLQLENPFQELEESMAAAVKAGDSAISKTMEAERAVASTIIRRCLKMLENNPEWSDVLAKWLAHEKIGLAWKRYDRLEWVHGANEQRLYGTLAMQQSHELELRPKNHYPTKVRPKDQESMDEPAPVEGFLIRLTSQKGHVRRLGKMYFKRLYFTTHNQYLCYCRPAAASPPPPPKFHLTENAKVPSANDIVDNTPLIYAVNPYALKDGEIEWLRQGTTASKVKHDEDACKEAERKVNSMLQADGYINLSHVVRVQNAQRGNSPADERVNQGPDVDFHQEVDDTRQDDGKTQHFDDTRTFELVMKNKLVIRLQAYNEVTKKEWMNRLQKLVQYWKLRLAKDVELLKSVRAQNLKRLDIDEETEAWIGQFGSKWEVARSVASTKLFNMCGIACCRAITMSGTLYRKLKRHSTFKRCGVILCHGKLLIFHGTLREFSGKEVPHIQHERQASIDLKNCYIYSGLVTEGDLLYQNQTFDSNHPGHHALPRVYLEDGWTSTDEDTMTCFVIWQPRTKSFFKANEEQESGGIRQRLRHVSKLGVPGRSTVFRTRSRAERDHWVMSIGLEIDRLQGGQDIRVVEKA